MVIVITQEIGLVPTQLSKSKVKVRCHKNSIVTHKLLRNEHMI